MELEKYVFTKEKFGGFRFREREFFSTHECLMKFSVFENDVRSKISEIKFSFSERKLKKIVSVTSHNINYINNNLLF